MRFKNENEKDFWSRVLMCALEGGKVADATMVVMVADEALNALRKRCGEGEGEDVPYSDVVSIINNPSKSKISAIKKLRASVPGLPLKQAKDAVEYYMENDCWPKSWSGLTPRRR